MHALYLVNAIQKGRNRHVQKLFCIALTKFMVQVRMIPGIRSVVKVKSLFICSWVAGPIYGALLVI